MFLSDTRLVFMNTSNQPCFFLFLFSMLMFCCITFKINAQTDTLKFSDGAELYGEVKFFNRNIIRMETAFSDSDFNIEWDKVTNIRTVTTFLITLSDGRTFNGRLESDDAENLRIITKENEQIVIHPEDLVYLDKVDESFGSRLSA